jgi:tetratricopeptide (TPR) repeat protein
MDINDKIWLIKSSGRILGPMSISEVVIHLQQQALSVIDEMSAPFGRWILIREHQLVMSILKEMGGLGGLNDISETTNTIDSNKTQTKTKTEITQDAITDEFVVSKDDTQSVHQAYQKVISAKEKEIRLNLYPDSLNRSYATRFDPRIQERIESKKKSQRYILIGSISLFVIIVVFTFAYQIKKQKDQITLYTKSLNQAREQIQFGEYQSALEIYEKVYSFNKELFSSQDILNYSLLLVKMTKRIGSAEAVLSRIKKPENIIDWRLWMMSKLNISMAKEAWDESRLILNELEQALPNDPEVELAMAQNELFYGNYERAFKILEQNINTIKGSRKYADQAAILMAKIALISPKQGFRSLAFSKAIELLQTLPMRFEPFYFYKKILLASLQLEGSVDSARQSIEDIWRVNIYEPDKFVASLTSIQQGTSPETLLPICIDLSKVVPILSDKLSEKEKFEDYASSIEAICYYFSGNKSEAYKTINIARKRRPSSAVLASVEANFLLSDDRVAEASARVSLCGNLPHCRLARMRECFFKEDDECLSMILSQTDPQWIGPFYNLVNAEVAKKRGNDFSHKDQILKGLQSFPDYQPLMVRRP